MNAILPGYGNNVNAEFRDKSIILQNVYINIASGIAFGFDMTILHSCVSELVACVLISMNRNMFVEFINQWNTSAKI